MISVYDYLEPQLFLNDFLEEKKKKNPNFSLRAWALKLEMSSHGPLHAMLKGQRNIPKKYVPLFIKNLNLKDEEAKYFEILVDLQRSKTQEEKELHLEKLKSFGPKAMRSIADVEGYKYITDPLHLILSELVTLKKFEKSISWIKQHLRFNINLMDIEDILARLVRLDVLEETTNGYKRKVQHIYTSKEKMSEAIQLYHKKMGHLAVSLLSEQDVSKREFNAITFNIKHADLQDMKEKIRSFTDQLIRDYEAEPEEGDETYHLNIQLFSLSK